MARYQLRAVERFLERIGTTRGVVLEVGSDVDGGCLRELAARGFALPIGVNPVIRPEALTHQSAAEEGYALLQADVRALPLRDAAVAAIFSVAVFEHVHDFDQALTEMFRVLEPGGIVYSDFGPLWSSSVGHHVYVELEGIELRHWKPGANPVPHFAHLLQSPEEMARTLASAGVPDEGVDAAVEWIFRDPGINRLFFEEYRDAFERSPFHVELFEPVREHVPSDVRGRLEERYPGRRAFDVRMLEVCLRKPTS